MIEVASSTGITDEELHSVTSAILKRYGVDFTCYEPLSLKRRLDRAINLFKLGSIHELWVKLLRDKTFIYALIDEIAVGLTSMFRDPELWKSLKLDVLRKLYTKDLIHIWHAGCSSGEEVYTMGIVLRETGMAEKASAIASDISQTALKQAQQGQYHELKMAEYISNYDQYNSIGKLSRYFTTEGNQAVMDSNLVNHVRFQPHNLITDTMTQQFDIIFCRNVMIYFDQPTKARLLSQFYDQLHTGGFLVIGFLDTLTSLLDKSKFQLVNSKTKIFQKVG